MEGVVTTPIPSYLAAFRGRRCLVTGHTGFKGTWLAAWLERLGATVAGLALPPEETQQLFAATGIADRIESTVADVRSLSQIGAVMSRFQPDIVFHLAAQSLVRRGYADPVGTFETNVMGTANLLESARSSRTVRAIVVVTSDKCYESLTERRALTEDDPLGGSDPYSASKAAAELVTAAFRRSFFAADGRVLVASARAGNVIGAGDGATNRLVPDIVRAWRAGEPIRLRNPHAIRPWQHVLEPLRGYLMLGAKLLDGDATAARAWNFGPAPEAAITVADLTRRVLATWGSGTVIDDAAEASLPETGFLQLDSSLARRGLGFAPVLGLDEAIALTVAGYRDLETDRGGTVVDRQIEEYARRLR